MPWHNMTKHFLVPWHKMNKHFLVKTLLIIDKAWYEWNEDNHYLINPQLLENMIQHICFSSSCIVLFYRMFLNATMINKKLRGHLIRWVSSSNSQYPLLKEKRYEYYLSIILSNTHSLIKKIDVVTLLLKIKWLNSGG